jgi:hypothetical protein
MICASRQSNAKCCCRGVIGDDDLIGNKTLTDRYQLFNIAKTRNRSQSVPIRMLCDDIKRAVTDRAGTT